MATQENPVIINSYDRPVSGWNSVEGFHEGNRVVKIFDTDTELTLTNENSHFYYSSNPANDCVMENNLTPFENESFPVAVSFSRFGFCR